MVAEMEVLMLSRTAELLFLSHPLLEKVVVVVGGLRTAFRKAFERQVACMGRRYHALRKGEPRFRFSFWKWPGVTLFQLPQRQGTLFPG
jgi:hypothetical protein